jgi:hypothetical protein
MVEVRVYISPTTGEPHVRKHGVTEDEARQVLAAPGEDRPGAEGARVAIGQTESGRYVRIIYVPDPDGEGLFVITGYQLVGKPLAAYKRRRTR